jgi:hypothetical protein
MVDRLFFHNSSTRREEKKRKESTSRREERRGETRIGEKRLEELIYIIQPCEV